MVTFVWLEEEAGQREEWKCAAMECGGLSVEEDGTPWMLPWYAGSSATSMKVSVRLSYLHMAFENITHTLQYQCSKQHVNMSVL